MTKKYSKATLQSWIEKIQTEGKNLSKWEESYVEDIASQLEDRGTLSERQIEILERIYSEKTR